MKLTQNKISFHHEIFLLTLLFIVGGNGMKFHFGVGQRNDPLKNENKPERDRETSMLQDTHLLNKIYVK